MTDRITFSIGDRAQTFALIATKAPAAYDTGGAIEYYDGGRDSERYVLIPEEYLQWQIDRNHSGMYPTEVKEIESFLKSGIQDLFWNRLYGKGE